ncbi:MAG: hypothetical protein IPP25_00955 [Saprospiraceae bacterium]|nr:hypothetical protein [Candidatus Opimibacter skivensis]
MATPDDFYAIAWREIRKQGIESTLCIPSGNYGNIAAAFLMHDLGMTFKEILAAHNANDTIPRFLSSGKYAPEILYLLWQMQWT